MQLHTSYRARKRKTYATYINILYYVHYYSKLRLSLFSLPQKKKKNSARRILILYSSVRSIAIIGTYNNTIVYDNEFLIIYETRLFCFKTDSATTDSSDSKAANTPRCKSLEISNLICASGRLMCIYDTYVVKIKKLKKSMVANRFRMSSRL